MVKVDQRKWGQCRHAGANMYYSVCINPATGGSVIFAGGNCMACGWVMREIRVDEDAIYRTRRGVYTAPPHVSGSHLVSRHVIRRRGRFVGKQLHRPLSWPCKHRRWYLGECVPDGYMGKRRMVWRYRLTEHCQQCGKTRERWTR